jgi:hypothetical protein
MRHFQTVVSLVKLLTLQENLLLLPQLWQPSQLGLDLVHSLAKKQGSGSVTRVLLEMRSLLAVVFLVKLQTL